MIEESETTALELPKEVVSRVEDRVSITEFDSAAEYVAFVLDEVLYQVEMEVDEDVADVDEQDVRDRLHSLGYLEE